MKERAKIFTCVNPTNYQIEVNAAALELCQDDASLLLNRGKLFEEARKKVNASGYHYVKKLSRSTVYGTGTKSGKPKRKYVSTEIRAARVKEVTDAISSHRETIELLCKQKEQYSNAEKFLQAADVNSSILEKNREKSSLEKELKELNKVESKSRKKLSKRRRREAPRENTTHSVDTMNESSVSTDVYISSDSSHSNENDPVIPPLKEQDAIAGMICGTTVAAPQSGTTSLESVQNFLEAPKL